MPATGPTNAETAAIVSAMAQTPWHQLRRRADMARIIIEHPCVHDEYVDFGHVQDGWDSRNADGSPPPGKPLNHYCNGPTRTLVDLDGLPSRSIEAAKKAIGRELDTGVADYSKGWVVQDEQLAEAAIRAFLADLEQGEQ